MPCLPPPPLREGKLPAPPVVGVRCDLDDVEENDPAKPIEAPMQEKSEEREKWWEKDSKQKR